MKILLIQFVFIFFAINPVSADTNGTHTNSSGELNLEKLKHIEELICKKTGVEFENYENSFDLNGYHISTEVEIHKFGPNIYEEFFYKIDNPNHICRLRLVKKMNNEYVLAIIIKNEKSVTNYHAVFNCQGIMLEEDPWGLEEGYTIETFDLYNKYKEIFIQEVNALNYASN